MRTLGVDWSGWGDEVYRRVGYVREQVEQLARQVLEAALVGRRR
jgi:hypothetical protein